MLYENELMMGILKRKINTTFNDGEDEEGFPSNAKVRQE